MRTLVARRVPAGRVFGISLIAAISLAGCSHTDAFVYVPQGLGPPSSGADIQLTLNQEQNYWPTWTEDGRGVLYAFVDPNRLADRCIGLLPARGGTLLWEFCDNRASGVDSTSSFSAFALNSKGQILYAEAVSALGVAGHTPGVNTLWLADTAAPLARTALVTLPVLFDTVAVSWLSELSWTGPSSFVALGQDLSLQFNCPKGCIPWDTVFVASAGIVVRGTIANGHANLEPVIGTVGATGYSVADGGASIVYTRLHDMGLYKVAIGGGTAAEVARVSITGTNANISELLGVSCKNALCIVATAPVWLFDTPFDISLPDQPRGVQPGTMELLGVSLATGAVEVLRTFPDMVATPVASPTSDDVVAQVGGSLGHLQTVGLNSSRLHLFVSLAQ